jgi:hypothetical protein
MIINPYFLLHALLNLLTGILVVLQDKKPNLLFQIIIEFHLYHSILYWKKLTTKDIIHHICTILVLGTCYFDKEGGEFEMKFALFSMCGFPDAIDFVALALYKNNCISKVTCLTTCCNLNVYIRMQLCILSGIITLLYSIQTNNHHLYFGILFALATICNGIYFAFDIYTLRKNFIKVSLI